MTMPRSSNVSPRRRGGKKNGGGNISYAESDDSDAGSVSDYQESDDSRCSTPESQKDTVCSVCNVHVASSDKSLQCDKCNEWCHIKCGGVTKEHYRQMVKLDESNIPINWYCPPCDRLENPQKYKNNSTVAATTPVTTTNNGTKEPNKTSAPKPVVPSILPANKTAAAAKQTNNAAKQMPPTKAPVARSIPGRPPTATSAKLSAANSKPPVVLNNAKMPVSNPNITNTRLVFPDAKVRDLPFFPIKAMLLRPCLLNPKNATEEIQQQNLAFYLSPDQANIVNSGRKVEANGMVVYKMHILLRFTKKSVDGVHDDDFPKNLCLKVNNKVCPLPNPKPVPANRPNMESKRPPKPLIITSLCKLNTKSCLNQMSISWTAVPDTVHAVSVYLVEKLSPGDLLTLLKSRGQRDPKITEALIKSKLEDQDQDEIATTSCKVSMACPLGMAKMTYPARSSTCDHLQCFDGDTYLRMNEKKPKWLCPVCNKHAYFENLFLDGFYISLLESHRFRSCGTNDIVLNQDATWEPVITEGHGVSDDSEDDGDPLAIKDPLSVAAVLPDSDPVSQLAKLPIAPAALVPKSIVNGMVLPGTGAIPGSKVGTASNVQAANATSSQANNTPVNDDFLDDIALSPEDNYTDWNYSIKFFTFFRGVPDKDTKISSHEPLPVSNKSPIVLPQQLTKEPTPVRIQPNAKSTTAPAKVAAEPPQKTVNTANTAAKRRGGARGAATTARGGRGRGGGRGGGAKRSKPDDDEESADDASSADSEDRAPRKKPRGGGGRGRGRGRGAARGAAARGAAKSSGGGGSAQKKSKYKESSEEEEEEESSESEGEVLSRPVVTKSGRPSRNCRQSTNYAEIEGASDVLDYLLEHR